MRQYDLFQGNLSRLCGDCDNVAFFIQALVTSQVITAHPVSSVSSIVIILRWTTQLSLRPQSAKSSASNLPCLHVKSPLTPTKHRCPIHIILSRPATSRNHPTVRPSSLNTKRYSGTEKFSIRFTPKISSHARSRYRKVTIWARVQAWAGENVSAVVPDVIPWSAAQATASA